MKKFLNIFFVTLGVIFLILIILSVWFVVSDPLELRPLIYSFTTPSDEATQADIAGGSHPMLSTQQETTLENLGVDVEALPTEITPEMEQCFTATLGTARVDEIKAGASPGITDFLKAKSCIGN